MEKIGESKLEEVNVQHNIQILIDGLYLSLKC